MIDEVCDGPTVTDMQSYAAKWILKTRETQSLTRSATQGVVEDVQDLISFVTQTHILMLFSVLMVLIQVQ